MKKLRLSVLSRLLVLFLTILAPLFSVGAWGVYATNQKLENQISDSMQQSTENFARLFDNQLIEINRASLAIIAQGRVAKFESISRVDTNYETSYETYYNINIMRDFMSNIQNVYGIIHNIRVYLPSLKKAYNANGYEKGSVQDLSEEEYRDLLSLKSMGRNLIYDDQRLISVSSLASQTPRRLIEVEYNLKRLSGFLSTPLIYNGSYFYFFLRGQDFHLTNLGEEQAWALRDRLADDSGQMSQIRFPTVSGISYSVFQANIPSISGTYIQIIPRKELLQPSILSSRYVYLLLLFMLLGVLMFFGGAFRLIHKPLNTLILAFRALGEDRNFDIRVSNTESPDFAYLYSAFNKMAEQLHQLIYHDYYQGMLLQKANFKQLQAQINPHFLYNSYFMLYRMILSGQHEESKTVAKELGSYFRYITKNHSDTVTLKDEYTHAKIYSNIQTIRFGERIRVEFQELPECCASYIVPKLILQPIVENAFNYGLENKVSNGFLKLNFQALETSLMVSIDENGDSLTDETIDSIQASFSVPGLDSPASEIGGLVNIYKRLQLFYRRDDVLSVSRSPLGGMSVKVYLHQQEEEAVTDVSSVDCG